MLFATDLLMPTTGITVATSSRRYHPSLFYGENLVISGSLDNISTGMWLPDRYVPCHRKQRETNGDDEGYPYEMLFYFVRAPLHFLSTY